MFGTVSGVVCVLSPVTHVANRLPKINSRGGIPWNLWMVGEIYTSSAWGKIWAPEDAVPSV